MDILLSDEFIAQIEAISKIVLVRQNEDFIVFVSMTNFSHNYF